MPRRHHLAFAVLAVLAAVPAPAHTLFKCVQDGKTVYQSEPCTGKATQSEIRAPAATAAPELAATPKDAKDTKAPEKPKPGSKVSREEMEFIVDTFVGYTICAEADPGFAAQLATGFEGWKERNASTLERFNQDAEGPKLLDTRLQSERQRLQGDPGSARAARLEMCARPAGRGRPQPRSRAPKEKGPGRMARPFLFVVLLRGVEPPTY